jgi:mono/diheme cytochrome c family protein
MLRNFKTNRTGKVIAVITSLVPLTLLAQTETTKTASASTGSSDDLLWYSFYAIMALLLLVIMKLGKVLTDVVKLLHKKRNVKPLATILLLFISGVIFSQALPVAQTTMHSTSDSNLNLIMAIAVLGAGFFVVLMLILRIRATLIELVPQKEQEPAAFILTRLLNNFGGSSRWKCSFIIFGFLAVGYLSYYAVMCRSSGNDEYEASVKVGKEQREDYARLNAAKVNVDNVTMADAAGIAEGKEIFMTNCSPCHGRNGEGVVGPNLTDGYWLHGGSINDIFKSISTGWPAKGMKAWQADLSPVQIKDVASFIKSIYGTKPANAKAPEGDLSDGGKTPEIDSANRIVLKGRDGNI